MTGVRAWSALPVGLVSSEGWTPGLPFVTDPVHHFYGQDF